MFCYECSKAGKSREAVALCHHCSAALCPDHACVISDSLIAAYPICKTVVLPQKARLFLCETCFRALRQVAGGDLAAETPQKCRPPAAA